MLDLNVFGQKREENHLSFDSYSDSHFHSDFHSDSDSDSDSEWEWESESESGTWTKTMERENWITIHNSSQTSISILIPLSLFLFLSDSELASNSAFPLRLSSLQLLRPSLTACRVRRGGQKHALLCAWGCNWSSSSSYSLLLLSSLEMSFTRRIINLDAREIGWE